MSPIRAEDAVIRPVLTLLSKGNQGSGKTIFSCSPSLRPTYVFNCEGRFDSVLTYYKGNLKDLEYDDFPIGTGYDKLDKKMDELVSRCEYNTVVMSSLTSFIYVILNHLIRAKAGQTRGQGNQQRPAGLKIGGIPVNELEDYNAEDSAIINDLISFFQQMKANGVNCILEAHITPYELSWFEGGQKITKTIQQILTKGKKAPASVPAFFNEIWLFEKSYEGVIVGKQSKRYAVNTSGSPLDDCKTSWDIEGFDFTNDKDPFGNLVLPQLSREVKETPRVDPNRPKIVSF